MTVTIDQLTYIPHDVAHVPRDGECRVNRWWIVHPEKGLAVWKNVSPQCNSSREIVESLLENYPGHELRWMGLVFLSGYVKQDY